MRKDGAVKIMDPPIKGLMERFPAMEVLAEAKETGKHTVAEVQEVGLRGRKAILGWWRSLPNNGVRAALAAGVGLVLGSIPVLILISRRHHTP
jgi:hypothetical protein